MVWFWQRDGQSLRIETTYDNDASECVVTIEAADGTRRTERYSDLASFRDRLATLEQVRRAHQHPAIDLLKLGPIHRVLRRVEIE